MIQSLLWLKAQVLKTARGSRCPHKVKGEVAVTEGFVPFKVPGSPVVDKTVFPSPLSRFKDIHLFAFTSFPLFR